MGVYADEYVESLGFIPSAKPPKDVYIDEIAEGSWAEQQDLRVDDLLLKVNGVDVYGMNKKEFNKIMSEDRPLELTFWRQTNVQALLEMSSRTMTAGQSMMSGQR